MSFIEPRTNKREYKAVGSWERERRKYGKRDKEKIHALGVLVLCREKLRELHEVM